ncbi:tetratricopeptide repeat protein [Dongia sp.]|uniref:tetratricopeptide repeat protein n=1 Tax=Dongia sp. TaxID=1977262 RepID=UPI003753E7BB
MAAALPIDDAVRNAVRAAETGDYEAAKRICAGILEQDAENAEALHLLGVLAYQVGLQAQEALNLVDRAIAAEPANSRFFNTRGALYYALGMNAEAEAAFRRALEIDSGDANAWNNLGNALLKLDQVGPAEACFREAIRVEPELNSAINNLGIALKREGALDKALACFRQAVLREPDYLDAHYNLADVYNQMDDQPAAERHFRRALEIDADCAPAHCGLAQCLTEQNRNEEALAVLKSAAERLPEDEDVQFCLHLATSGMIPAWHIPMINDDERNAAYERALARAVTPDSLVLEIGTGSGLVAMMAARAGARQVVTCEAVPILAKIAKETVARNGFADKITVLSKRSTQVKLGADLPEKADIFVSELINIGMLAPNMLPIIQHARANLVKPEARIIPQAAVVWGVLMQCDHLANINPVREIAGFDMGAFDIFRSPGYAQIDLGADPHRVLSGRVRVLDFDFRKAMKTEDLRQLAITANRAGTCHGVCFWFDLILDDEVTYRSESRSRTNHWKQAIHFFPEPVEVAEGDRLDVAAGYDNTRIFFNLLGHQPRNGAQPS